MQTLFRFVVGVVTIFVMIFAGSALTAFPIEWLWNWLVPSIWGLPRIDFWEAWGLAMAGLLFKLSVTSSKNQNKRSGKGGGYSDKS